MAIFAKLFKAPNEKYIQKLRPLVEEINSWEKKTAVFSDVQLKEKTQELKKQLAEGKTLDDVLAEAFALAREAAKRTLKQRPFDSQLFGGIALHQGKIAEMKTGEGKTLAATLPAYLNGLTGRGVHIVTVNDYLAKRDMVWMGQIYDALGLSVGCIVHENAYLYDGDYQLEMKNEKLKMKNDNEKSKMNERENERDDERDETRDVAGGFKVVESFLRPVSRKEAYAADITYGTNNEFGFDYLRDNMVYSLEQRSQRDFYYAIVDEIDSILIDEARTPLIISAPDMEAAGLYGEFAKVIPHLKAEEDYKLDEKTRTAGLTEQGIEKIEKLLGVANIYEEKGVKFLHHLEQGLRAEALFKRDRDYVVKQGQVLIVDEFTGRLMPGRRWSGGLHQAIEAKENVAVQPESMTLATITFQNYFRMYEKLSGMTGTALTSAEEFDKVYHLDVVAVPTNKPMARTDLADQIYKSEKAKFEAVIREIKERHQKGQPVLVGTRAIERNEYLGKLLEVEGVSHQILNAKQHEREGEIIAQAGRLGAVTLATNMAGRGVDIVLGGNPPDSDGASKVRALGGLHIIGTERHEARRIDNQLRGRGGRQGDPGSSQFFISLEDDLMRVFGGDRLKPLMERLKLPDDQPIEAGIISRAVEAAQSKIEGMNFDLRKHILEYDDVMNKHREVIYKKRKEILGKPKSELRDYVLGLAEKQGLTREQYQEKEEELGEKNMREAEKIVVLRTIDSFWLDHLYLMEHLMDSVRLRAYGQQDPLVEYKNEARTLFQQLIGAIEGGIANTILNVSIQGRQPTPHKHFERIVEQQSAGGGGGDKGSGGEKIG
ncbi:MAG: preprotein translocase subunit SecA, partial [Patescibacteria group bacterium]